MSCFILTTLGSLVYRRYSKQHYSWMLRQMQTSRRWPPSTLAAQRAIVALRRRLGRRAATLAALGLELQDAAAGAGLEVQRAHPDPQPDPATALPASEGSACVSTDGGGGVGGRAACAVVREPVSAHSAALAPEQLSGALQALLTHTQPLWGACGVPGGGRRHAARRCGASWGRPGLLSPRRGLARPRLRWRPGAERAERLRRLQRRQRQRRSTSRRWRSAWTPRALSQPMLAR